MDKPKLTRNQIHIISRHSNWPARGISDAFKQNDIYADRAAWARFVDIALISLGVAFCLAGVIFFFAYNWADLHKFIKLGIVQGLIVVAVLTSLLPKLPLLIKNLSLTAASVLTGVLFAVFGQIYQTGANTYDLFLGWTVFITLWALVANFAVLWLIWLVLVNTTLMLYTQQVVLHWHESVLFLILTLINGLAVVVAQALHHTGRLRQLPVWFTNVAALGAFSFLTMGVCNSISNSKYDGVFLPLALLAVAMYAGAIYYSLQKRNMFYLCVIPLSVLMILISLIVEYIRLQSSESFFMVGIFIIASIGITVHFLLKLKKHRDGTK